MFKRNNTTKRLLNLNKIEDYTLSGYNNHHLIFYEITPFNLAVLSEDNIEAKIFTMMHLIKGIDEVEIIALNSRENFKFNKVYIENRIEEEKNSAIKVLLEKDLKHLDEIQSKTGSARLFLIVIRIRGVLDKVALSSIKRFENSFKQFGFTIERLNKEELKTMLAIYFEQNVTTESFEDIDGERWFYE